MSQSMQHVVITGSAIGIGRALAEHYAARGMVVFGLDRDEQAPLTGLVPFQCNIGNPDAVKSVFSEISEQTEVIDLLVNNASGFAPTPIERCTEVEFDAMLGSNLKGPYFLIQGLLPTLRDGGGTIVNIIDVHATHPLRNFNAYCAAKAGLASLTRSLAVELAPEVRVNGVSPGAILWPEGNANYDDATREATVERTPLRRLGEPTDIAKAVRYLACDAPFVTGQVIAVDGGRTLEG